MYEAKVVIEGVADFLYGGWTKKDITNVATGGSGGNTNIDDRIEEAGEKASYTPNGELCVPPWSLKVMILNGCAIAKLKEKNTPLGKYAAGTIFVRGPAVFTRDGVPMLQPDYLHCATGKRPPRKGGGCIIYRPAIRAGWRLSFVIDVVDDRRDPNQIERAIREAGLLIGIGSWRPEYGRFIVAEFSHNRSGKSGAAREPAPPEKKEGKKHA